MAITKEQALAEAQARGLTIPQPSTITREQALAEASARGLQIPEQQRTRELFKQLGGRLPTTGPLTSQFFPGAVAGAARISPDVREIQRRKAFGELRQQFSREQIGSALAFEAGTKPPSTLPRTIGATVGSLAALGVGVLIPGPEEFATVPAAAKIGAEIFGAGLGGAIGRGLQVAADPDEDFTFGEFARVFGEEAALETLSIGVVGAGRKLLGGAKRTLVPEASRLSAQLVEAGERAGVKGRRVITRGFTRAQTRLLPAQFSENQLIDTVQGIGEGSLVGSNVLFQFKRGQKVALKQLESELVETFLQGAERRGNAEIGGILFDTITGKQKAFKETASQLYGAVDDLARGVKVNTSTLKTFAQSEIDRAARAGGVGQTPASRALLSRVAGLDDTVDFRTAQDVRSGLLSITRTAEAKLTLDPKALGLAKQLTKRIDTSMREAGAAGSNELLKASNRANSFFKAGSKRFNDKVITRLTRKIVDEPEIAARAIFQPRSSQQIQLVKKVAGKKTFNELRSTWLEQLLKDSSSKEVGEEGELLGKTFLSKFNNMGDDTLNVIFSPQEIKQIRDLGKTAALLQKKTGGVGGSLKILQGVAAFGLVASPLLPEGEFRRLSGTAAGLILLGPAVVARMMTNPTSARLLSEGFKLGTGTRQGVALTARLVRDVLKTRKQLNKERSRLEIRRKLERERETARQIFEQIRR